MSDVNWWLMLLAFLLGAIITWFWSVRRATREVPRTVVDRDRNIGGSAGAKLAGAGAGVAGVAAGAAALGDRDKDVDLDVEDDLDLTTRRGDLNVDRPATEVYDRTADSAVETSWDAPEVDAPAVDAPAVDAPAVDAPAVDAPAVDAQSVDTSWDAPEVDLPEADAPSVDTSWDAPEVDVPEVEAPDLDAPTVQRSSLDLPDVDSPGVAGGAAAAGAAGLGTAAWASSSDDAEVDVSADAATEPVHFTGGASDIGTTDTDTSDVDTTEEVVTSSDAEIIESESGLETAAAPTGEADWSEESTDVTASDDSDEAAAVDTPAIDTPALNAPGSPEAATSVMSSRDAVDIASAKEPVVETESSPVAVAATGAAGAGVAFAAGRFGKGSAQPNSDGSGPSGWAIKGNEDSMLFHTEDSPYYGRTKAEVWFEDEDTARQAGFTKWNEKDRSGSAGSAAKLVAIPEGKFGKGSADPAADGSGPEGWTIKGNEDSNLFHTEDSPYYGRTKAEVWFDTEDAARGAGFVRWNEKDRSGGAGGPAKLVAIPEGKFGKGSADPAADGSGPEGWTIKGNEDSNLFHTEDSPYYGRTKAEVWFDTEDAARGAGFVRWNEKDRSGGAGGPAKLVAIPEGKFGKGSADPAADGSGPEGWTIKGNEDSNLFHTEDSPYYGRTKAEIWFDTEDAARGAGFVRWNEKDRSGGAGGPAKLVEIPEGRFGKGSAEPGADGSGPDGWAIKGNENSMLFHTQDSPAYGRTKAEVWFQDEETARKAGFTKWNERHR